MAPLLRMLVAQTLSELRIRWRTPAFSATNLALDRKSTRLNSSHSQISYAVFCLKKKITESALPQQYRVIFYSLAVDAHIRAAHNGPDAPVLTWTHFNRSSYVVFHVLLSAPAVAL